MMTKSTGKSQMVNSASRSVELDPLEHTGVPGHTGMTIQQLRNHYLAVNACWVCSACGLLTRRPQLWLSMREHVPFLTSPSSSAFVPLPTLKERVD